MPNYFTLIPTGARANAATWNAALTELDNTLAAALSVIGVIPTLPPYLANPEGRRSLSASISAGSNIATVTGGAFTSADRFKKFVLWGAGVGGIGLASSIVSIVDDDQVELAQAATYNIVGKPAAWGAPSGNSLNDAVAALDAEGGGVLLVPKGIYCIDVNINLKSKIVIQGMGMGLTTLIAVANVNMLLDTVGGHDHMVFTDLDLIQGYANGWTGGQNAIRFSGFANDQAVNTDTTIRRVRFICDNRTTVLENVDGLLWEYCEFEPATDGFANLNISQPSTTNALPSPSKNITIQHNRFKTFGLGRTDQYLIPGDTASPANTGITGQALINLRVNDALVFNNRIDSVLFLGGYCEGELNQNVIFDKNVMRIAPGFPGATTSPVIGIWSKIRRGITITHNKIFGTADTFADVAGKGSTGIKVSPGSGTVNAIETGDILEGYGNYVEKFTIGAQIGDTNDPSGGVGGVSLAGNFNWHHNHYKDSKSLHAYYLLGELDSDAVNNRYRGNIHHNKHELSVVASNVTATVTLADGMELDVHDEVFIKSNDAYKIGVRPGAIASTGKIRAYNSTNDTGNAVWRGATAYRGRFSMNVPGTKMYQTPLLVLSDAAITHDIGQVLAPPNWLFLGIRVRYIVGSSAAAGVNIDVKSNNTTTLMTYVTEPSKAAFTVIEKGTGDSPYLTATEVNPAHTAITVTCAGLKSGAGSIVVEVYLLPN